MVAKLDVGLRPNRQREFEDLVSDDEAARADVACAAFRQAFEEADAHELPSFRPLKRGMPATRHKAGTAPRDPPPCDAPLPFSRARALSAADAPVPPVPCAAPHRDRAARSLPPVLLAAIFLAGTIAGLGGAVAARVDRLDAGKVEQAGRALSLLVERVAWRDASGGGGLAVPRRVLPTIVESALPADPTAVMTNTSDVTPPAAAAAQASEDAIPAAPVSAAASFALERGDEAMRQRDVIVARRFYEFAASAGVAGAATALARTYDPIYLQQVGIRGVRADIEAALRWYKRASAEGDRAARPR